MGILRSAIPGRTQHQISVGSLNLTARYVFLTFLQKVDKLKHWLKRRLGKPSTAESVNLTLLDTYISHTPVGSGKIET